MEDEVEDDDVENDVVEDKCHGPETRTTLCQRQLAQSKCTWAFHKSHFIQKFTGKMPRPRVSQ